MVPHSAHGTQCTEFTLCSVVPALLVQLKGQGVSSFDLCTHQECNSGKPLLQDQNQHIQFVTGAIRH